MRVSPLRHAQEPAPPSLRNGLDGQAQRADARQVHRLLVAQLLRDELAPDMSFTQPNLPVIIQEAASRFALL